MGNIALLVPNEEMMRQAHNVLQEMHGRLAFIKMIRSEDAVSEARQVINAGADVIIARGLQASIIKQYTNIPVVEIVLTRQSVMGMLERAARIIRKENPVVAFVLFQNMTCDMSGLDGHCGVRLREYYVQHPELLRGAAVQAIEDGADLVIGGETVLAAAEEAGVPSLFLVNAEDAMCNAILEAQRLLETFEREGVLKHPAEATARQPFVNFPYESAAMEACLRLAEQLSRSSCPKLIIEPVGSLSNAIASAIHNHSPHSKEKLIQYDCVPGEDAYEALFGRQGKLLEAARGSIQINDIGYLDLRSQKRLAELLRFRHVIGVSRSERLVQQLIPELYHRLHAFAIRIPALDECPEDVRLLTEEYFRSICERYGKYHVLTKGALKCICAYAWPGNRVQLESYLERLVLCASHRSVDERLVRSLYEALYAGGRGLSEGKGCDSFLAAEFGEEGQYAGDGALSGETGLPKAGEIGGGQEDLAAALSEVQRLERKRILASLTANMGNREKTAEALGISKSTLWRKMKGYRLLGEC